MRRRVSTKPAGAVTVVRHYETDIASVAQALLVVLTYRAPCVSQAETQAEDTPTAAVPTRSNAPAGGPTGALTDIGTVTSNATNKQGSSHDTTRHP